jgi:hypothetical protein
MRAMIRAAVGAWVTIAIVAAACKKDDTSPKAAPAAPAPPLDAAPAAAAPDAAAKPALPSLGAPPAGMDAALAAACDRGDGKACFAAADAYSPKGGYRAKMSKEEADLREQDTVRYAQRGCELDVAEACHLAAKFLRGQGQETAQQAALERGCALGHPGACGDRGAGLVEEQETAAQGLALLEKACRGNGVSMYGDPEPGKFCHELHVLYLGEEHDHVAKDEKKAAELKALGCAQGFKLGCPCTDDTEEQDCTGSDDDYTYFCNDGKCDIESTD